MRFNVWRPGEVVAWMAAVVVMGIAAWGQDPAPPSPAPSQAWVWPSPGQMTLGVDVQPVQVVLPGAAPGVAVIGLKLLRVYEGYPASRAGLEAGDVLIQVNGQAVPSLENLRAVLDRSGGRIVADVVDVRTSNYVRLPAIELVTWRTVGTTVVTAQAPLAPAMAAPAGENPGAGDPDVPSDPTFVAGPPASMPVFPWPPPAASDWTEVPAGLLDRPGTDDSYYDVGMKLTQALREAGYDPISYYWVPGGFAIVTRLEQFAEDGTPLADPQFRWSNEVAPPRVFGLRSYLQALFTSPPGRFRVIVLVVTAEPFRQDVNREVTAAQTEDWIEGGLSRLPVIYRQQPYTPDTACTALIYEFLKDAPESQVVQRTPGLPARVHLQKSQILGRLGQP
jgi:hypothetical protein